MGAGGKTKNDGQKKQLTKTESHGGTIRREERKERLFVSRRQRWTRSGVFNLL
jgi:hypothetical protein